MKTFAEHRKINDLYLVEWNIYLSSFPN